jgi:hypothetical protein
VLASGSRIPCGRPAFDQESTSGEMHHGKQWAWVLIGLEVNRGAFWPEERIEFWMPPDELEMHWQCRLYAF